MAFVELFEIFSEENMHPCWAAGRTSHPLHQAAKSCHTLTFSHTDQKIYADKGRHHLFYPNNVGKLLWRNIYFTMTQLSWDESLGPRSHMAISARVPGGAPAASDQSRPGSELPSLNLPARGRERARFLLDFWDNITIFIVKILHSPALREGTG